MLMTTTHGEGLVVERQHGIVTGEAILGTNIFRDMFAGIRNIVGGRSGAYEKALREARETAFEEMREAAERMGANAVIAIDIDYENITAGDKGSMLMVSVSGTAVSVR